MQSVTTDLFATKGMEYLLVIGYLFLLVACWRFMFPRKQREPKAAIHHTLSDSFAVPEGVYFHQGHTWAAPETDRVMRVGIDDFAEKLLGRASSVVLPAVGTRLVEGEPGWQVKADGSAIPVLSPVDGEVVAVNDDVLQEPELINRDPYDRGWLMKVRVASPAAAKNNLLSGKLAHSWMDTVSEKLREEHVDELGLVGPDGTVAVSGLARALAPNDWDQLAREFLLVEEPAQASV